MAFLTPDQIYTWNGLKVKEYLLTKHNPRKISMPSYGLPSNIEGITVHNTGWIDVSSLTTPAEQYTRATLNNNMGSVRVHFYVDNVCAWQNLPLTLSGWHAADGNGKGNRKTISIEVIGNSKQAEDNAARLVAFLLDKYKLNVDKNVFTHTHWLNVKDGKKGSIDYLNTTPNKYKTCPIYIIPHWEEFKNSIKKYMNNSKTKPIVEEKKDELVKNDEMYRIRLSWDNKNSQIGAFSILENAKKACKKGYNVYNNKGELVYANIDNEQPSIIYNVYTNGKWLGEKTSNEDSNIGIVNSAIRGLAIKSELGAIKYRVHVNGGGWLSWIDKCDIKDWNKGCAGIRTKDIDAIQIDFSSNKDYDIQYRASTKGSDKFLPWVTGFNLKNDDGYAGIYGKSIDKFQIRLIKK